MEALEAIQMGAGYGARVWVSPLLAQVSVNKKVGIRRSVNICVVIGGKDRTLLLFIDASLLTVSS